MLTRLRVNGFKNLVDVDIYFGPFTCIAGSNGVGKSNLFDAILFLSSLSNTTLVDAALSVRSHGASSGDIRSIFNHVGSRYRDEMTFEAEMIVPPSAIDDLGQRAQTKFTFLRYKIVLGFRTNEDTRADQLFIKHEELEHIKVRDAVRHLPFEHSTKWRKSAVGVGRRSGPFISTEESAGRTQIRLHQDGGPSRTLLADSLPRSAISSAVAVETPTALLARREMQSWRMLQLEPSALRAPDSFSAPSRLGMNGAHIPATLARLARVHKERDRPSAVSATVYSRISNRLADLLERVRSVKVDVNERRELLTLIVTDLAGTDHDARSLSDGTLRFLALCILEADPEAQGLLCLEEPENGIHPARIPAMLALLNDLALDAQEPIDDTNPLRQVIVNTHSPSVVNLVPEQSLVVVTNETKIQNNTRSFTTNFRHLSGTWRAKVDANKVIQKGMLLSYLNPAGAVDSKVESHATWRRVMDRADMQIMLPLPGPSDGD